MNLLIIFVPLPARHRGGTAPRLGGSARQFQVPLESARFSHREGRKKSVRKAILLGGPRVRIFPPPAESHVAPVLDARKAVPSSTGRRDQALTLFIR